MPVAPAVAGMTHVSSPYSVSETLDRLAVLAAANGLVLFARIDFGRDAAQSGLNMPSCQLLILGNPKAGTHLMLASPTTAIDLPLKALAWEDDSGNIWLSANTAEYLQLRHNFPPGLLPHINSFHLLLEAAIRP